MHDDRLDTLHACILEDNLVLHVCKSPLVSRKDGGFKREDDERLSRYIPLHD